MSSDHIAQLDPTKSAPAPALPPGVTIAPGTKAPLVVASVSKPTFIAASDDDFDDDDDFGSCACHPKR